MLLPAIVCGGIYAVAEHLSGRNGEKTNLLWLTAVALGIGYLIGHFGIEKKLTFPPKEGIHWLFYFTLFALFSSNYWDSSHWKRLVSQIIYSVALPRIPLHSYFQYNQYNTWGTVEGIIWWGCLSVGIFIFWHIVQQSFSAIPSKASISFVYFGLSGGTALILALCGGGLRLTQHAGVLIALFAAVWILTVILQRKVKNSDEFSLYVLPINISPVITLLFVGIWMNGYFYGEAPSVSLILLAISPVLAQVGRLQIIQSLEERKSVFIQVGLIALCVSIAIIIAVFRSGFFGEDNYY